jgi:hypothetical protein
MKRTDETTPFVNILMNSEDEPDRTLEAKEFLWVSFIVGSPKVQKVKALLGRQDYTWMGSCRYWIWERGNWRVFVNNDKGLCFEVLPTLTVKQAIAEWEDFKKQLGVTPEKMAEMKTKFERETADPA